jgi:DNA-binding GntR family transcriptional regulator
MIGGGPSRAEKKFKSLIKLLTEKLREAIINGKFVPGEKLSEETLAATLHVGRVALRETLRSLEAEGYVTFLANNEVSVSKPTPEDVQDYYTIASVLEGLAARLAVENAQAEEIAQAHLKPGEEEDLRASKNILTHSEKLNLGCREGEDLLYEGDAALVGRLGKYTTKLRELAAIDSNLQPTEELIQSSLAQLQEAAAQLRRYAERVHFDPRALEQLEDRLAEIQRLKRKYNASVDDILRMESDIRQSLDRLENSEEQIAAMEKTFTAARGRAWCRSQACCSRPSGS